MKTHQCGKVTCLCKPPASQSSPSSMGATSHQHGCNHSSCDRFPSSPHYISWWFLLMQTPLISDTGKIRSELIKSSLWDKAHVAPAGQRCDVPCPQGCCTYVRAAMLSSCHAQHSCTEFSLFASSHPSSASC